MTHAGISKNTVTLLKGTYVSKKKHAEMWQRYLKHRKLYLKELAKNETFDELKKSFGELARENLSIKKALKLVSENNKVMKHNHDFITKDSKWQTDEILRLSEANIMLNDIHNKRTVELIELRDNLKFWRTISYISITALALCIITIIVLTR